MVDISVAKLLPLVAFIWWAVFQLVFNCVLFNIFSGAGLRGEAMGRPTKYTAKMASIFPYYDWYMCLLQCSTVENIWWAWLVLSPLGRYFQYNYMFPSALTYSFGRFTCFQIKQWPWWGITCVYWIFVFKGTIGHGYFIIRLLHKVNTKCQSDATYRFDVTVDC